MAGTRDQSSSEAISPVSDQLWRSGGAVGADPARAAPVGTSRQHAVARKTKKRMAEEGPASEVSPRYRGHDERPNPRRQRSRPARRAGAARAPPQIRRLDAPQGQARSGRVVRGSRSARGRGGDRAPVSAGARAAGGALPVARPPKDRPLLAHGAGGRRAVRPQRRDRRAPVGDSRGGARAAELPARPRHRHRRRSVTAQRAQRPARPRIAERGSSTSSSTFWSWLAPSPLASPPCGSLNATPRLIATSSSLPKPAAEVP